MVRLTSVAPSIPSPSSAPYALPRAPRGRHRPAADLPASLASLGAMTAPSGRAVSTSRALRRRFTRSIVVLFSFTLLLLATIARAATWTPPPLKGHVVDQAGALTDSQAHQLDRKLSRARRETGFAIVVYLMARLPEGMSIEDVGYTAGNAWGVGSKSGDDGVLLIASLGDRKLRIETGKGVGGALTDIQSSHINRDVIGPLMKNGRVYEAMDRGADAILKELVENTPGGKSEPGRDPSASRRAGERGDPAVARATSADVVKLGVIVALLIGVIVLAIVSPTFREILFWILLFGRFGGGGGRGSGGGGSSDDGYGGGGGSFGGGGSSDDY